MNENKKGRDVYPSIIIIASADLHYIPEGVIL